MQWRARLERGSSGKQGSSGKRGNSGKRSSSESSSGSECSVGECGGGVNGVGQNVGNDCALASVVAVSGYRWRRRQQNVHHT